MWTAQLDDAADAARYAVRVGAVVVAAASAGYGAGLHSTYLLGLDWGTGERRWKLEIAGWPDGQVMTATEDLVVFVERVPDGGSRLVGVTASTGDVRWRTKLNSSQQAGVSYVNGEIVAVSGSSLLVLDLHGRVLRRTAFKGVYPMSVTSGPAGDFVLTSWKGRHTVANVAKNTLQMLWSVKAPGTWAAPGPALVVKDTVVLHSNASVILAIDAETGSVRWTRKKKIGREGVCLPFANGDLLWGTDGLTRAGLNDGAKRWSINDIAAVAVTDDDRVITARIVGAREFGASGRLTIEERSPDTGALITSLDVGPAVVAWVADDKAREPFFIEERVLINALQPGTVSAVRL